MRALAKRLVRENVGVLPFFEYRLRLRRVPEVIRLRRREDAEVERASRRLGGVPTARVATVIPTYRRARELVVAVRSALAQTVADHVVIVVDDGAGLPALPDDPRLVAVSLSQNIGVVGVVRNVGIRISESEFLAFLDDDNEWDPDHLRYSLAAHARGAEFTYTGLHRVTSGGETVDVLSLPFDRRALRETGYVDASTIVVRRRPGVLFSRTPRRFGEFPREDWELAWRLSRRMRVEHLPEATVRYVVHEGSHFTDWRGPRGASAS